VEGNILAHEVWVGYCGQGADGFNLDRFLLTCDREIVRVVSLSMKIKNIQKGSKSVAQNGLLSLLIVAALSASAMASAQDIRASVDGNMVRFPDVQPIMMDGRVMVPVRGVFEQLNAEVKWDSATNEVTALRGNDTIRLTLNSSTAIMNNKPMYLDSPATMIQGRTMVPLRFLSEALGASVDWVAASRLVEIKTMDSTMPASSMMRIESGTVVPFVLKSELKSNVAKVGDRFTAEIDTKNLGDYQGIPKGAVLEGHVEFAQAKAGDTPGVLGLAFDRMRLLDGQVVPIYGSLIGLDEESVMNENGRLVAKPKGENDDLKYVGYGAGAGALVAVLTKGNVISNTAIGAALGYLLGIIQPDPKKASDVTLKDGNAFGVRLTSDLYIRPPVGLLN